MSLNPACRRLLTGIALAAGLLAGPLAAQESPDDAMVVTLLGTGQPDPGEGRRGFSNLVQAGGLSLIFDAGRAATMSLAEMGVPAGRIDAVFLTHYHSDHVNGLADLFLMGYLGPKMLGGRQEPFQLYGPEGVEPLARGIEMAHARDAEIRLADEVGLSQPATTMEPHTVKPGVVFDRNGVTVTMFPVLHGDLITPSVGYRVDYRGHSVVFSGDTRYDANVIEQGRGADLLIHEVALAPQEMADNAQYQAILGHHTTPEEAGQVFAEARPRLAVYSHMVRLPGPRGQSPLREIVTRTRKTYSGPLVLGEDLMQFRLEGDALSILIADE